MIKKIKRHCLLTPKKGIWKRHWGCLLSVFLTATIAICSLMNMKKGRERIRSEFLEVYYKNVLHTDNSAAAPDGVGCHLPDIKLDDPEIMKFIGKGAKIRCGGRAGRRSVSWISFELGTGRCRYNQGKFAEIGGFTCSCKYIRRGANDFHTFTTDNWEPLADGQVPKSDFVRVRCAGTKDPAKNYYRNDFAVAIPYHDNNEGNDEAVRSSSNSNSKEAEALSVYMLAFDTVSRLFMQRKLPKTYAYLVDQLEAVVLKGYNIVGDGTPQALIPILTGQTEPELPQTRKRYGDQANYVNVYPWAWDAFRKAGYATLYSEDTPDVGTFTYRLKGFKEQPTTHDMRTFFAERMKLYKPDTLCIGNEKQYNVGQFALYGLISLIKVYNNTFALVILVWSSELNNSL